MFKLPRTQLEKHVLSKVSSKMVDRLNISVEAEGSKPVNVTVEIELALTPEAKGIDAKTWLKKPLVEAHKASEKLFEKFKMNDFQKLLTILKESQAAFVLLLCHRSADADAICSAYGLAEFA